MISLPVYASGRDPRPVLSASQVETWLLCRRKRYLRNALGLREDPHPSARVGTAVHRQQEKWLKDGIEPDGLEVVEYLDKFGNRQTRRPAQILQNGRHLLPPPRVAIVEGDFTMATPGAAGLPVRWRGAMDWVACEADGTVKFVGQWLPPCEASRLRAWTRLVLGDTKTTGNPIYAKTTDDLVKDVQANLYAYRLMQRYPVDVVHGRWVYFLTDENPRKPSGDWVTDEMRVRWAAWVAAGKPLAWPVDFAITRPMADRFIAWLDTVAEEIFRLHVLPEESSLQNSKACDAYGGCPYRTSGRCEISAAALYDRLDEKGEDMGIADMQAALAAQMGTPVAAPAAPAALPSAPSAPAAPAYWQPGDKLNEAQQLMASAGKPLWIVAVAGTPPTPTEIAMAWPAAQLPVRVVDAGTEVYGFASSLPAAIAAPVAAPVAAPTPPAPVAAPAPPAPTPVGVPERGTINAPEAPAVAPATPEQAAAAFAAGAPPAPPAAPTAPAAPGGALDRDALKAEAVRRGLMSLSDRFGAERIAKLLADDDAKRGPTSITITIPPGTDPAALAHQVGAVIEGAPAPAATAAPAAPSAPTTLTQGEASGTLNATLRVPCPVVPQDDGYFVLFVNTLPLRRTRYDLFSDAAAWALAKFREVHKLPHYALAEYGKGQGVFASYVEQYYVEQRAPGGAVYVDTRSREGADALAVLERLASEVYRGH